MSRSHYITVEDVRNYILDRNLDDNELASDLSFSDEEIHDAMRRSARDYNSIRPFIGEVDADHLDASTNMFLDGTAAQLYISQINKLMRHDVDYVGGNISTNIVAKRIANYKELIKMHKEAFSQVVEAKKAWINDDNAFGQVG